jgi:transmembrane sensor
MKLSKYITAPPATEADLAREWAAIDRRSQPFGYRRVRRAMTFAAPLALAAALVLVWFSGRGNRSPLEGAVFGSDTGQAVVDLADGSHIEVEPRARLSVVRGDPRMVRLRLQSGSALFEVTHVDGRSFEVAAQGIDVRVIGTRFRVAMTDSERVHVAVERGTVELVRHGTGAVLRRMVAGQEGTVDGDGQPLAEAVEPTPPVVVSPPIDAVAEPSAQSYTRPEPRLENPRVEAKQLFDAASAARRAGKSIQAANLFDTLRLRYPSDPRAGLSAFELGRLRMDALGDPAGALEALSQAIASTPAASFREDAQARLVYASDAMHDGPRCRSMRQAYLNRYPHGAHAMTVTAKCAD